MAGNRFAKLKELLTPKAPDVSDEAITGRAEAIGQGAFGLGDEIGAGMQALVASSGKHESPMAADKAGRDTYNAALGENRDVLRREKDREPVKAAALETVAGAPLMTAGPLGKAAGLAIKDIGVASKLGSVPLRAGIKEAIVAAIPAGALSGYGHSDAKDLSGLAKDTAAGAGTSALASGALRGTGNVALKVPFFKQLAQKLQTRAITSRTGGLRHDPELDSVIEAAPEGYYDTVLAEGKRQLERIRSAQNSGNATVAGRLRALLGDR